jgi:septal ring factor EnvC (AmiA/AmiB activator)
MKQDALKMRQTQAELEQQKQQQRALKKEAEAVKKQREGELAKLQGEEKQSGKIVSQLKKDRKKYQNQLASKKKQVDALNREIERLVAEAMKSGGATSSRKPVDLKLAAEFSNNKGRLPWPAEGPVVDRFGQKYHPVYKNLKLPPNNGIDIALSSGTKVKAVFDGVVSKIVVMPGYNKCVLVQHGNYFSFYCKLSKTTVKAGDKIKTGDVIGTIDTINDQTQLHFQIWKDSTPQNPESWLR